MKFATNLHIIFSILFAYLGNTTFAQNTKAIDSPSGTVISNAGGTDIPHSTAILDVRSTTKGALLPRMTTANRDAIRSPSAGLLVYNTSTNQFNYHNGSSWQVLYLGSQWAINGSILYHSGKVGVGISSMINSNTFLTVRGNSGGTNLAGMYVDASSSTGMPFYGYSTGGLSKAYHYVDSTASKWALSMGGEDKLSVKNTGDVAVIGKLTVDDGKAVLYNLQGGAAQKYYTRTASFGVTGLAALSASNEGTINFPDGYTSPPKVIVGDITYSTCTSGSAYQLQLIVYNVTTYNCKIRIINTSGNTASCSITWNMIFIGN